jgi:hypothetical protein
VGALVVAFGWLTRHTEYRLYSHIILIIYVLLSLNGLVVYIQNTLRLLSFSLKITFWAIQTTAILVSIESVERDVRA